MTEQGVKVGNALIAEFDGLATGKDKVFKYERNGSQWAVEGLKYRTSWDWLIPVIKKMSALGLNDGILVNDSVKEYVDKIGVAKRELLHLNIEGTWLGVVKFIEWYNQKKKA